MLIPGESSDCGLDYKPLSCIRVSRDKAAATARANLNCCSICKCQNISQASAHNGSAAHRRSTTSVLKLLLSLRYLSTSRLHTRSRSLQHNHHRCSLTWAKKELGIHLGMTRHTSRLCEDASPCTRGQAKMRDRLHINTSRFAVHLAARCGALR